MPASWAGRDLRRPRSLLMALAPTCLFVRVTGAWDRMAALASARPQCKVLKKEQKRAKLLKNKMLGLRFLWRSIQTALFVGTKVPPPLLTSYS